MGSIFKILFLSAFLTSCTSLIYQPDKNLYAHPDQFKTKFETITFDSEDGTKLTAWKLFSKKPNPKNLLIYFHGNAQNLTAHFMNSVWMAEHDYDVIIFDYRGYGISEGEPNPKGVAEDGLAFLNYGFDDYKRGTYDKFIVYGQSLGGSVVMKALEDFKHRDEIALLVLDSTFVSPRDVAKEKTFTLLSYLISNDYTADPELKHIDMPVLSIHSTQDPVIAYKLGETVFRSLNFSPKKEMWILNSKGHGDVFFIEQLKYRDLFLKYVNNLY